MSWKRVSTGKKMKRFIRITRDDMVQVDAMWGATLAGVGLHKNSVIYADVLPDGSAVYDSSGDQAVEEEFRGNIILMPEEFELC